MAGRQSLSTFETKDAAFVTFHKTASTSAPFAQVESWKGKAERVVKTTQRVSDQTEYDTITAMRASGSIALYYKSDPVELGYLLGTTKPTAGGWAGTESIGLASTFSEQATYVMVGWTTTATATASVVTVTTFTNLRVMDWDFDVTSGSDIKYNVNWKADSIAQVPAAALGA
jgi:hypothetical protein